MRDSVEEAANSGGDDGQTGTRLNSYNDGGIVRNYDGRACCCDAANGG